MENKEYHILNQPFAPEDYEKEVTRIRAELQHAGQYNLRMFFASPYEEHRLQNESDSAIQTLPPILV